jgi:hypothetical protein
LIAFPINLSSNNTSTESVKAMLSHRHFGCYVVVCLAMMCLNTSAAQSPQERQTPVVPKNPQTLSNKDSDTSTDESDATKERESKLAEYLSGAIFSGQFTVDGKKDLSPKAEEYTISKCEKLPTPDLYRLTARIKYGQVDSEVPMDIKILWSGNTPVITLDSLWIPGMGTFSARVLIHSNRYAGTWQHDAVGGHMFGMIKRPSSN